jgi:class 3 adenylate cyclase
VTPQPTLESRLYGSRPGQILRELLGNSAHFPIANLFYEALIEGADLLRAPDPYILIGVSLLQAWFVGTWRHAGRPRPLLGNLIGPASYSVIEGMLEGSQFFVAPHHTAYWAFSLLVGAIQQIQLRPPTWAIDVLLSLVEGLARAGILFLMYWLLEFRQQVGEVPKPFFTDPSHVYIALALSALGLLVGLVNTLMRRSLRILRETAGELRRFSEWAWGKDLVARAIADKEAFALRRRERGVVFIDIRGFTAWSERQSPELVVEMLNRYYSALEAALRDRHPVKTKYSADEAMVVFGSAAEALASAGALRDAGRRVLAQSGLSAGVGVHCGPTVEGLLGSADVKLYDVIGDTVNIAKRLCDQAGPGEILASRECATAAGLEATAADTRPLRVKGKSEPIQVCVL